MLQYIDKVLYILSDSKRKLFLLVFIFLVTSSLEAFGIGLIGPFLSLASQPESIREISFLNQVYQQFQFQSPTQFIFALGISIVLLFCLKSIAYFFSKWYIFNFSLGHQALLTTRLMNSYLSMPYSFYLKSNTAQLIKNIVVEVNLFIFLCLLPMLECIINLIVTIALVILMASTSSMFLLAAMAFFLPLFLAFNAMGKHFKKWGDISAKSQKDIISAVNHGLGGFKETRIIGCEVYFEEQVKNAARRNARAATLFESFQVLPRIIIEAAIVIFLVSVVSFSILFYDKNFQDLISVLGVFAIAGMRLVPSASNFLQSLAKIRHGTHALNAIYFDLKDQKVNSASFESEKFNYQSHAFPKNEIVFSKHLEVKNITYQYPGALRPAIENLSLTIRKGESIAFVGKSGSGKTTLADIILGLLQPETGDIFVDNVSIYDDLRSWQNLVGYIPQSIFLSDDSIERNIAFGVPDHLIDTVRLSKVIKTAQLDELIAQLPDGIQTSVGERGVRLSGGQRQRIGIARALYHEREILVLDEATSALDTETEKLVSQAIDSLAGDKTLIVIAHRLSTVEQCNCVYLLDTGRVIKSGSLKDVVLEVN